jgi:hypothetical protein
VTGIGELAASRGWVSSADGVGFLRGLNTTYAALSFELEDVRHRDVLSTGRRGAGANVMTASAADGLVSVPHEGGVREEV